MTSWKEMFLAEDGSEIEIKPGKPLVAFIDGKLRLFRNNEDYHVELAHDIIAKDEDLKREFEAEKQRHEVLSAADFLVQKGYIKVRVTRKPSFRGIIKPLEVLFTYKSTRINQEQDNFMASMNSHSPHKVQEEDLDGRNSQNNKQKTYFER